MAANPTSKLSLDDTVLLGEKSLVGGAELEEVIGLKRYKVATVAPVLTTLKSARDALTAGYDAQKNAFAEIRAAVEPVDAFNAKMIDRCKGFLGRTYNVTYKQLGLDSLALPSTHAYRLRVIESMAGYLTTHAPIADPTQGITAVIATGLHEAYRDALTNAEATKSSTKTLKDAEQTALQAMRATLRGLIKELSTYISPVDRRWKAFGFNCPGDPQVPDQVLNLIVTAGLPGSFGLTWDAAPRGARYLVEMSDSTPEAEWTLMATVAETSVALTDLVPGATVQLRVTAANDGGEAVPSEPVTAQVPVAIAA